MHLKLIVVIILCTTATSAQTVDTAYMLRTTEVTAYGGGRSLAAVPAAVSVLDSSSLRRYSNTSLVPALNTAPGVRMEERSPGSYRLSIRGSSLRSPFGVRNVKVYYNGIPVTDPGGFSYLNQFTPYSISSVEIIKGPGSSLYGAGTGGVLLLSSGGSAVSNSAAAGITAGSYGLLSAFAQATLADNNTANTVCYNHIQSAGYRQHSALSRNTISWDGHFRRRQRLSISGHFLYNDLNYQTPGGLTLAEYTADPRAARLGTPTIPGAVQSRAAVYQSNALAGASATYTFSRSLTNTTTAYALASQLTNPNIRNYSRTTDPHYGGRTVFQWQRSSNTTLLRLQAGAEAQAGSSHILTYRNNMGNADTLVSDERVKSSQVLLFAQGTFSYKRFTAEAGASVNRLGFRYSRVPFAGSTPISYNQLSPRIAVMYRAAKEVAAYVNVARGFAPPTTAELVPSGSIPNLALRPEYGWSYEAGLRGITGRLQYDVCAFYYQLTNAIVARRDSAGGDTYINAGGTRQRGIEARLDYEALKTSHTSIRVWASYTGYHFRYHQFTQLSASYSGNQLPGTPAHTVVAGIDAATSLGLALHATWLYNSPIALNDANTAWFREYHLVGIKAVYSVRIGKLLPEVFAGVDNLLNEQYSLGNDINAAGGRYYNAAPGINYYAGLQLRLGR